MPAAVDIVTKAPKMWGKDNIQDNGSTAEYNELEHEIAKGIRLCYTKKGRDWEGMSNVSSGCPSVIETKNC